MLQIVKCSACNQDAAGISVEITFGHKQCSECFNVSSEAWRYSFCSMRCFGNWAEETRGGDLPCQECNYTGFQFGHQHNGKCLLCKGKKTYKPKD